VTDAEGGTVTYEYDAVGNRIAMTDANSHATTYDYDALSRLTEVSDPLTHTITYAYDAVGNRASQTKADGTVITHTYDANDRLVEISGPGLNTQYGYDAVGSRQAMTDAMGVTKYTYDELNRLTQVAGPNGTLQYDYDLSDSRTHLAYPDGKVVTYTYDLAGRLTTVTDWAGRVTGYTYDEADRQTAVDYPNAVHAAFVYDDASRLLSIEHSSPVSGTIAVFTYTLDEVGNRLTMQDLDGTTTYGYDDLYRLTDVTYPDGEAVAYGYDTMGNRTVMTSTVSGVVTYTYDNGDRLLSYTGPGGTTHLTWDDNGNMTGKGGATYTFDALDRLTQVVSGTTTVQFAYNGDGVRLGKTVNGTATDYVQDVAAPLPVVLTETTGGQSSRYVYGNDLIAQVDPAGSAAFYHTDGLGNTRALSNLAGQRTDAYSYDVFGALRSHSGASGQSFTFSGEQTDGELGLVYLRMRYYDAQVGRFITQDQFEGFRDGTQSRHRYVYVDNNPVGRVDPAGLTWQLFGGLEGGFMLGPIKIGGSGKAVLELGDGISDAYFSGTGGAKAGFGLDVSFGPKAGIAYEHEGGLDFLPKWLQIKGGKLKLPLFEVGGKVTREEFKIQVALRAGGGLAFEPEVGLEARGRTGNLKNKLGDWIFDHFYKPRLDAEYNRIMAEHHRRMLEIQLERRRGITDTSYGSASWGGPPSGGK